MKLEKEAEIKELTICHTCVENENSAQFNCFIDLKNTKEENVLNKIYNSSKIKLTLEAEEPILDEAERKYLSDVIRPFRDRIEYILKSSFTTGREFLHMKTKDGDMMDMFPFEPNKMYKGMKLNKEYSLEELGL